MFQVTACSLVIVYVYSFCNESVCFFFCSNSLLSAAYVAGTSFLPTVQLNKKAMLDIVVHLLTDVIAKLNGLMGTLVAQSYLLGYYYGTVGILVIFC